MNKKEKEKQERDEEKRMNIEREGESVCGAWPLLDKS